MQHDHVLKNMNVSLLATRLGLREWERGCYHFAAFVIPFNLISLPGSEKVEF